MILYLGPNLMILDLGPNLIILDLGQLLWEERGVHKFDMTNLVYQRMFQHPKIN